MEIPTLAFGGQRGEVVHLLAHVGEVYCASAALAAHIARAIRIFIVEGPDSKPLV